ncbi:MAG TPA: hypothetical protein VLE99_00930 [Candidatus Saccharimonadales bacterium]|nr:hypothetical protein [Candidatus Saccharimonadales bacterium]
MFELSTLTFATVPQPYSYANSPACERIVGIRVDDSKFMFEHGYQPTGIETVTGPTVTNRAATIQRVAEFYKNCRVAAFGDRPRYDCYDFAELFLDKPMVWEDEAAIAALDVVHLGDDTIPKLQTTPGDVYVIETPSIFSAPGELYPAHAIVGTDDPGHSVGVLGVVRLTSNADQDSAPVVVATNNDVYEWYRGERLRHIPVASKRSQ